MKHLWIFLLLPAAGCGRYDQFYYAVPGPNETPPRVTDVQAPPSGIAWQNPQQASREPPVETAAESLPPAESPTPGYRVYPQMPRTDLYPGGRFGYAGIFLGVGGMPGQNDIRPGLSWTVVLPPGGVVVTAVSSALLVGGLMFDAMAYAGGYSGEPIGTYLAVGGMSEVLPFTEDMCYQGHNVAPPGGVLQLEGVSLDLYVTGSRNRDLTNSADVLTYGGGLNAAFLAGLGQGGRARFMLGYEYRRVDFKARADGDNHGPMVGVGLEFSAGGRAAFSTQFRYVFTFGTASEYDFWDVSAGAALYW